MDIRIVIVIAKTVILNHSLTQSGSIDKINIKGWSNVSYTDTSYKFNISIYIYIQYIVKIGPIMKISKVEI